MKYPRLIFTSFTHFDILYVGLLYVVGNISISVMYILFNVLSKPDQARCEFRVK